MLERQPPAVADDTPIGPDVDLDTEDIRLADGTRLTPEVAEDIAEDVRRRAGRPSLTEPGTRSPQLSTRVPGPLHAAAQQQAKRRGISISRLLREALEQYLKQPGGGIGTPRKSIHGRRSAGGR
jgi:hypothetical protein